jgi:hypothetical protein
MKSIGMYCTSLIVRIMRWEINIARMRRRNSHTNLFLKIQGSGESSAEMMMMMIMSLVVRKVCGGMDFIILGRNSVWNSELTLVRSLTV